jgi:hypothetical protein
MTDTPSTWPKISIGCSMLLGVWLTALAGVATMNVVLLVWGEALIANPPEDFKDWLLPGETFDTPPFYNKLGHYSARAMTVLSVVVTLAIVAATLSALVRRRANYTALASLYLALPLGLTPLVIRVLLPWENPWTGAGSPAATCMSLPFIAVIFGLPIAIPAWHFISAMRPSLLQDPEPKPPKGELALPTLLDQM